MILKNILNISECYSLNSLISFFSLERFLISLVVFSSLDLGFSNIIYYEKNISFFSFQKKEYIILLKEAFEKIIFRIIKVILSAKYYQENKERLQKKVCKRYQNLSEEKKEKKWQYGCERHKNLLEDENQKLVEYRKKYYRTKKNTSL